MHTVTKELRTETAHRLTNYNGRCAHLHGHSYLWVVTATSPGMDDKGMVVDFKDLKKAMEEVLDPLDHCLVLAPDDPLVKKNGILGAKHLFVSTNGESPRLRVWHENPTAESFAEWAFNEISALLPENVSLTKVYVWETATSFAGYKP